MDLTLLVVSLAKIIALTFLVILPLVSLSVMAERRFSAILQDRVGPNRTNLPTTLLGLKKDYTILGMGGLLQPLADGLKFILKEDFTPAHVKKFYFWLAPALTLVPALLTCVALPFGSELDIAPIWNWLTGLVPPLKDLGLNFSQPIKSVIADLSVGPLFMFAIASLGVYGIVLAGWSSNSKYPFLGSVRSTSQMISYELSLGLAIIPVIMFYGDMNLGKIVAEQDQNGWLLLPLWGKGIGADWLARWLQLIPLIPSFVIFVVAMFAETNRLPFDLPECETELVAGYHTEYSSMKFALFFMGEYAAMIIGSGLAVTLFLGGWSIPFAPMLSDLLGIQLHYVAGATPLWLGLIHVGVFFAKVSAFILFFILVRWTVPRFRYDQLMKLGWFWMFELALLAAILSAVIMWQFPVK
jgi:NADH-quinone oxidoreductase subunit H